MMQTRKNGFRIAVTLLFMVVLMLGLTVTAYAYGNINAEGGKFTAKQGTGSWKVDQIRASMKMVSLNRWSLNDSGDYDFLYSNGEWYPGDNGLENVIIPARTGYTFNGHYTGQNGTGTKGYDANGAATSAKFDSKSITLYAYWTQNKYTVTLDANGGKVTAKQIKVGSSGSGSWQVSQLKIYATYDAAMPSASASVKRDGYNYDFLYSNGSWYESDANLVEALKSPTLTGYTFVGWFDAKTGGTKYYNADGTSARTWNKASDTTLYAQWTPNTYTVTFDRQNGTGGSASATATYAANMPNITAPTYSGFTFLGYFDAATGGTKYYNANGTSAKAWDKTANATLYAQWQTNNGISVANQTLIIDAFKWAPTNNTAITVNLAANFNVDYALESGIIEYAGQNIILDLKGYSITQINKNHTDIIKLAGGTLTIRDSSAAKTGKLTMSSTAVSCSAIWINNVGAVCNLESGTITGIRTNYDGGGVCLSAGTFSMKGGVIENCTAVRYGGAVYVAGTFNMSGGVIRNCSVTTTAQYQGKGGAVYMASGTYNMSGGYMINCTASRVGGGVMVSGTSSRMNMTGGIAWNCSVGGSVLSVTNENGGVINKTGGLVDPAIDLTLENPLAPIVNITMKDNIDLAATDSIIMKMNQTVTLELNGKTLTQTNPAHTNVIQLAGATTLHIQDSVGGGTLTRSDAATSVCGVYVNHANAVLYLHSGTISRMNNSYYGSGVCMSGGKFYMSGGAITDCVAGGKSGHYGGGVYLTSSCTFEMSGGTIKNCTAGSSGGGVDSDGIFTMTGGSIEDCTSGTCGGGVYVHSTSTFTMTDSIIKDCTAKTYGGGVYVKGSTGKFYMTRSTIEGCKALYATGGGVDNDAIFTMTDSIIKDCSVVGCGGALYNYSTGTFTMSGNSKIINCSATAYDATWNGRGGAICNIGTINMENGEISGCTTANEALGAGGVEQSSGTFNLQGGILWGNKNTVTGAVNSLYQTGGTLNKTGGYIDPKTVITLDPTGGTAGTESVTVYYGDTAMPVIEKLPTRAGYSFGGFFDAAEGGTQYYDAEGNNIALSEEKIWDKLDETMTLYAQWTANTYTVTLNNGEGSGDTTVTATYDAVLPDVTVPTWEKHVFEGYFTEADGKGTQYIDKDGKGVKAWDKTSDTTLCAFWKDSAKIESMDLLLGGDIGMRYHIAVNDPELQQSGAMTVSIGSKKPSETTVPYSEAPKDESGAILFPFTVSSIQMAGPVTVEFKDKDGKVFASDARSVEDYYNLVENSSATEDQKEMVRTLVNYGYHAQQALSKTNGWSIGTDYKASSQHGSLSSTADDLKAYRPVISGSDPNVKDIQLSLLLDNKTTLCIYVQTKNGDVPAVTVDEEPVSPEDNGDGWWLVRIPDIDALNLSTMHTVTANGYTVYLSALSYASVAGQNTTDAMRALLDYYQATLKANGKKMLTSATVEQSEYDYTGQKIEPVLTVMAGNEEVEGYHVEWNGDLINAGTYTGLVTKEDYVGGVTVKVTIKPVKVEAPVVGGKTVFTYNGMEQFFLATSLKPLYTLENNSATDAGEYTAIAALKDKKNTCWTDGTTEPKTYDWRIDPMEVPVPIVKQTEFTYDGTQKTVLTVDEVNSYTVTGNTGTEAGDYEAIVKLKDKKNNCWNDEGKTTEDKTIEWSIVIVKTKVEIPAIPEATSFTYNGQAQTLEITESEYYTVDANTGTDVGEYEAIVTLKDIETTCWSDESTDSVTIPWKITKKEIAVPTWTVHELMYNGSAQTGVTVEENAAYTLTGNTGTNAASHTATLALTDPTNTCWNDDKTANAKTIGWSIARKQITVPTAVTGLVYNGKEQTGVNGGEGYTLSGTTKAKNAGSYTATATLKDTENTCWNDEDKTTEAKIIEWSIAKADPEVVVPVIVTYYPNGGSAEFSGSMTVEGKFSYDPSNGTTFTPDDTQNYNTVTVEAEVTEDQTPVSMNVQLNN